MNMVIRDARPEDESGWRKLWKGFLAYYSHDLDQTITDHTWERLMLPSSPMKARVAEDAGRLIGFAIYQHHPSSWVLGDDCYLEDLFVDATARGHGVGRALISDLMELAQAAGWHRLYWNTEITNATARKLYDSFVKDDGHIRYRLSLRQQS